MFKGRVKDNLVFGINLWGENTGCSYGGVMKICYIRQLFCIWNIYIIIFIFHHRDIFEICSLSSILNYSKNLHCDIGIPFYKFIRISRIKSYSAAYTIIVYKIRGKCCQKRIEHRYIIFHRFCHCSIIVKFEIDRELLNTTEIVTRIVSKYRQVRD